MFRPSFCLALVVLNGVVATKAMDWGLALVTR